MFYCTFVNFDGENKNAFEKKRSFSLGRVGTAPSRGRRVFPEIPPCQSRRAQPGLDSCGLARRGTARTQSLLDSLVTRTVEFTFGVAALKGYVILERQRDYPASDAPFFPPPKRDPSERVLSEK